MGQTEIELVFAFYSFFKEICIIKVHIYLLEEKVWKNQIEKLRTERNKEFAPPQSYNTKGKKSRAQ